MVVVFVYVVVTAVERWAYARAVVGLPRGSAALPHGRGLERCEG